MAPPITEGTVFADPSSKTRSEKKLVKKPRRTISLQWVVKNIIQNLPADAVEESENPEYLDQAIKLLHKEAKVSPSVSYSHLCLLFADFTNIYLGCRRQFRPR